MVAPGLGTAATAVVVRPDVDATVMALRDFLVPTSQNAKSGRARFE
jgi:hypothetical protein